MANKKLNIDDMLPIVGGYQSSFKPFYDYRVDYNTNAPSYYEYLAQYNNILKTIVDQINRLMAQSLDLEDTETIEYKNTGNHLGKIERFGEYTDNMKIKSNVKISSSPNNSLEIKKDGIYSKNLEAEIAKVNTDIEKNKTDLKAYAQANNRFAVQTTEGIKKLADKLETVEKGGDPQTIKNIENRLSKIESGSSTGQTDPALEKRVTRLEAKVEGQQDVLKLNQERQQLMDELFKQYNKRFDDLETKVKDLTKLMTSLSNAVLVIQNKLTE